MNPADTNDLYKRLGIDSNASPQEIESAYRRMAVKWHPDRQSAHDKPFARKQFIAVTEAHDILSDSAKRAQYSNQTSAAANNSSNQPSSQSSYQHSYQSSYQSAKPPRYSNRYSRKTWTMPKMDKINAIKGLAGITFVGFSILGAAYLGNEYILKTRLEREIRTKEAFYSEYKKFTEVVEQRDCLARYGFNTRLKHAKKLENQDYMEVFGLNIVLESLIKLGNKRGYDISLLNKADESLDSRLMGMIETLASQYSDILKNPRLEKERKRYNNKILRFLYSVFGKELEYPSDCYNENELGYGYIKALKDASNCISSKYHGMKVNDRGLYEKIFSEFNERINRFDEKLKMKYLAKLEKIVV